MRATLKGPRTIEQAFYDLETRRGLYNFGEIEIFKVYNAISYDHDFYKNLTKRSKLRGQSVNSHYFNLIKEWNLASNRLNRVVDRILGRKVDSSYKINPALKTILSSIRDNFR